MERLLKVTAETEAKQVNLKKEPMSEGYAGEAKKITRKMNGNWMFSAVFVLGLGVQS